MNRRVLASFFVLLYLSAAVVFGVHHHAHTHEDATGHDHNCPACQWQLGTNADPPVIQVVVPLHDVVCFRETIPVSFRVESPFLPCTASRAPPTLPA